MKGRKLLFLSIVMAIVFFVLARHEGNPEVYEERNGALEGTWYSEDPDDHCIYNIYADGTYVFEGRYELEGSILNGVNTEGTYRISLDGKTITFKESGGSDTNKRTGHLDEDGNLHLGSSVYHR